MEPARPLREIFADLAGHDDPGLAGHEGLPDDLLIRAIGSYADTAPAEVAEHLSAFVAAPSDADAGLHLLAEAPVGDWAGEVPLDGETHDAGFPDGPGLDDHFDNFGHLGDLGNADTLDFTDSSDHVTDHDVAVSSSGATGDHDAYHPGFGESSSAVDHPPVASATEDTGAVHADVPVEEAHDDLLPEHPAPEEHSFAEDDLDHHFDQHDDGHDAGHDDGLDHFAG